MFPNVETCNVELKIPDYPPPTCSCSRNILDAIKDVALEPWDKLLQEDTCQVRLSVLQSGLAAVVLDCMSRVGRLIIIKEVQICVITLL